VITLDLQLIYTMRLKNNQRRFALILIFMLFIFQNAWAIEQTYLTLCNITQSALTDDIHVDNETDLSEHEHTQCADCCHLNTNLVTILQLNYFNYLLPNKRFQLSLSKQFHSVYHQPPLPPPIV